MISDAIIFRSLRDARRVSAFAGVVLTDDETLLMFKHGVELAEIVDDIFELRSEVVRCSN